MKAFRAIKQRVKRRLTRAMSYSGIRVLTGRPAPFREQIRALNPRADALGMKVLCFSPYTRWTTHSAAETLLMHALRLRGHDTQLVMCDGVMPQCDIFRIGVEDASFLDLGPDGRKTARACRECQSFSRHQLWQFGIEPSSMSDWLSSSDKLRAQNWADATPDADLTFATIDGFPIGEWVASSVQTHFRTNMLDLRNETVAKIYRRYLVSGFLSAKFIERYFDSESPDLMLLFNGRMAPTRVALEIAKRKGVRTVVEERGLPGRYRFLENAGCLSLDPLDRLWAAWKDYPLNSRELSLATSILQGRKSGTGFEGQAFSNPAGRLNDIKGELGIDNRPVWLLMTSSMDEVASESGSLGLFESQAAWIEALINVARACSEVQLVIRVHPNIGSARSIGNNTGEMNYFSALGARSPRNVIIVESDRDVSTYDLMDIADAGFIWHTTAGMEMAALGKQVFSSGGMFLKGREFLTPLAAGPNLTERIFAARENWDKEAARRALKFTLRFAYTYFFRQSRPVPLLRSSDWRFTEYDLEDAAKLLPGENEELDELAEILEGRRSIYDLPDAAAPKADCSAETMAIETILSRVDARSYVARTITDK